MCVLAHKLALSYPLKYSLEFLCGVVVKFLSHFGRAIPPLG